MGSGLCRNGREGAYCIVSVWLITEPDGTAAKPHSQTCPLHQLTLDEVACTEWGKIWLQGCNLAEFSSQNWKSKHFAIGAGLEHINWIPHAVPLASVGPQHNMDHFIYFRYFTVPEPQRGSSGGKRHIFPRVPIARNSEWSWHKSNEMKQLSSPPSNPRKQWHLENCVLNELARAGVQETPAMSFCVFEDVCSSLLPSAVWR